MEIRTSRFARLTMLGLGFLLSTVFAPSTWAAGGGDAAGWAGVQGGLSVPNYSNSSARGMFGITAGAKVGSEFGIGVYYDTSKKDETANGTTFSFGYDLYGVMGGYFFEGEAKGVYLGAMLGMTKLSSQSTNAVGVKNDISTSPMHYGLVAGFDKMLTSMISLGGEISYIAVASSSANVGTPSVTVNLDSFSTLNALAALKFWF